MTVKYSDLEHAFHFASAGADFESQVILDKTTGEFYYISDVCDADELPNDYDSSDHYIEIPGQKDLDLGKPLVLDFTSEYLPDHIDEIYDIFRRKGAYSRFKSYFDNRNLLDQWYVYEREKQKEALFEWCSQEGIEVID